MWAYLRLNLDVSLSKKERPRPPAPLPWLIEETSLLSVPVLAGTAFARRSFAVLPEMVVRYTAPRWKLTLLPAAAPGTVGIRAETPGLDTLSDGLRSQHTSTEYRPLLVHARTDADNQLFHSPHAFNGLACTRSKTPHSVGDPEPRCRSRHLVRWTAFTTYQHRIPTSVLMLPTSFSIVIILLMGKHLPCQKCPIPQGIPTLIKYMVVNGPVSLP